MNLSADPFEIMPERHDPYGQAPQRAGPNDPTLGPHQPPLRAPDPIVGEPIDEPARPNAQASNRRAHQTLGDRYLLLERLGAGGMGEVWKAADQKLEGRTVAIKFIQQDRLENPAALDAFVAEIRTLAGLTHPGVVRILDTAAIEDDEPYFVMEYVDGLPLDAFIRRRAPERGDRLAIVRDLCLAVHELHGAGVLHRDLKPQNVVVRLAGAGAGEQPRPIIIDFGLAADFASLSRSSSGQPEVLGTPSFMSPEGVTLSADQLDQRTDVFALGVLLYYVLTESVPVEPKSARPDELRRAICESPIEPPSAHDRTIPQDLDAIVLRAIARDRTRRYPSARAMADDLDRFLTGRPVQAHIAGQSGRSGVRRAVYGARKSVGRHRAAATVIASLGLLAASFGGVAWYFNERAQQIHEERAAFYAEQKEILGLMNAGEFQAADARVREALETFPVGSEERELLRSMAAQLALVQVNQHYGVRGPVLGPGAATVVAPAETERSATQVWTTTSRRQEVQDAISALFDSESLPSEPYPAAAVDPMPTIRWAEQFTNAGLFERASDLLERVPRADRESLDWRIADATLRLARAGTADPVDAGVLRALIGDLASLEQEAAAAGDRSEQAVLLRFNRAQAFGRLGALTERDALLEDLLANEATPEPLKDHIAKLLGYL